MYYTVVQQFLEWDLNSTTVWQFLDLNSMTV